MDQRLPAVAQQLLLIERELRVLALWSVEPPAPEALASVEPFCVDSLRFEQWLQWIFLPQMKTIVESGLPLPAASGICAMAEVAYREAKVVGLLEALRAFDRLIEAP
ncbi:pseudouridine synthase [Stutzerimonas decontaminans]|uniref:Pseudouridine synthase n=2 Tax=Stutzerimonas TaxID=2901164 RepID=A0ABX4VU06_9GAMM|nr:YqcC family protein [Stutzerimonas decontaminans]AHY44043.1 pseudouridine synthase [Stutzerimonas decontaminans]MCQ4243813.1 YqcC family protein [Stutzerimonas decontaminans]MCW8158832.1 YqcC family protein [Stutzerimonas stutzeri]PNF83353.1 pseudouridine synthase [Stutzerimonas decontaminans]